MKPSDLHGIFPPITTPFVGGKVAYDQLAGNIARWNKTGLKGYVAFGSNGRAPAAPAIAAHHKIGAGEEAVGRPDNAVHCALARTVPVVKEVFRIGIVH